MLKWLSANYEVLEKKNDYTDYFLHSSDNFTKILVFKKKIAKGLGFFWHSKDQKAVLYPTITVRCGGVTPRPSQLTLFETIFKPRMAASAIKT